MRAVRVNAAPVSNGVAPAIRRATPAEVNEVISLERETPTAPHWHAAEYSALADEAADRDRHGESGPRRVLLVAVRSQPAANGAETRVGGFVVARVLDAEAEIESVVVRPDERRQGLGSALCRAAMAWARAVGAHEVTLEVRARSAGAILLYGGLGFCVTARRPGYYHDPPDDALLMHCSLTAGELGAST